MPILVTRRLGRVELWCPDCAPGGHLGFGLHTISYDAAAPHILRPTPRLIGNVSIASIERHVTRKLQAAAAAGGYDALVKTRRRVLSGFVDKCVEGKFGRQAPAEVCGHMAAFLKFI